MNRVTVWCRWCGTRRGVVYIDTPRGPYGILFCPRCDWAHAHGDAGPPGSLAQRIRDIEP